MLAGMAKGELPRRIRRVAILCPSDTRNPAKRIPKLVVGPATPDEQTVTIDIEEGDTRGSGENRTHGVFSSSQPPKLQAYTLLIFLLERQMARCSPNEQLPLDKVRELRDWQGVKTVQSLVTALYRIAGDSDVLETKNGRAWIRDGVTVVIEPEGERDAIFAWARKPHDVSEPFAAGANAPTMGGDTGAANVNGAPARVRDSRRDGDGVRSDSEPDNPRMVAPQVHSSPRGLPLPPAPATPVFDPGTPVRVILFNDIACDEWELEIEASLSIRQLTARLLEAIQTRAWRVPMVPKPNALFEFHYYHPGEKDAIPIDCKVGELVSRSGGSQPLLLNVEWKGSFRG